MAARKKAPPEPTPYTLEDLLTSPTGFGLVNASPLQRAICRIIEGLPLGDLGDLPELAEALGEGEAGRAAVEALRYPTGKPREVYLIAGSRCGKTLIAAAISYLATQRVNVDGLGLGDEPRVPVLSLDKDKAKACYDHLVKNVSHAGSPGRPPSAMRHTLVREGKNELDSPAAWIRHPAGREIQVCTAANKAAGNAVVSYFLAGVVFDEACKMAGEGEAVVNFAESRKNSVGRLLPGGQLIAIGSPWAPFGPMYDAVQTRWGKPGRDLVVIKGRGRHMNPWWWNAERIAETPADILATEEACEFRDIEESLVAESDIKKCVRTSPASLPREEGQVYTATMDPATRSNAWTLTIGTRKTGKLVVALAVQWLPRKGAHLDPEEVFREIATICLSYGLNQAYTDQFSADANKALARRYKLTLIERAWNADNKRDSFRTLADRFVAGTIEIPNDPDLILDLKMAKRRVTQEGVSIVLPERIGTNGLKRHCDYDPSLAMLDSVGPDEPPPPPPPPSPDEAAQAAIKAMLDRKATAWWERGQQRFGPGR